MQYNPRIHHRRTIRLQTWDYSWPSWYYLTSVEKNRRCVLGFVKNGRVELSPLGATAGECWKMIPAHHAGVELDEYTIMPNHIHGIIIINDSPFGDVQLNVPKKNIPTKNVPTKNIPGGHVPTAIAPGLFRSKASAMGALSPRKGSLSVIVRTFKAAVTTWARNNGAKDFAWQSRFHDHIIRDEAELSRIRRYIANNPLQWAIDGKNVDNR